MTEYLREKGVMVSCSMTKICKSAHGPADWCHTKRRMARKMGHMCLSDGEQFCCLNPKTMLWFLRNLRSIKIMYRIELFNSLILKEI